MSTRRMPPVAIREAAWMSLIALATTLIALTIVFLQTIRVVDEEGRRVIDTEVSELQTRYQQSGATGLAAYLNRTRDDREIRDYFYVLALGDGRPLAGNLASWPAGASPGKWSRFSLAINGAQGKHKRWAEARALEIGPGYRLLVGHLADGRYEIRDRYFVGVGWSVVLAAGLGLLFGYWRSRRALKFVDAVTDSGQRFLGGALSERLPVSAAGDEYDRLAETVNACFASTEHMVESLRAVTDGMAHDLRTPMTRIRARLDLARMRGGSAAELQAALDATEADIAVLLRLIEDMLRLARAEATQAASFVALDAAHVAREMAELYGPVAEDKGLGFACALEPAPVRGQRALLAQLCANLLDNAIKYTPQGGTVRVATRVDGGEVAISVADSGPGIPAGERERVRTRFVRLDESRATPGAGLGLSLVDTIARVHGGRLLLRDAGPGLCAEVRLPVAV